jgi:DNA replication protein DnaC
MDPSAALALEWMRCRAPQRGATILTTNKSFGEWNQVFPSATCVVTLVDRLVHRSEILAIEADSYRFKEAQERAAEKAALRATRKKKRTAEHP